MSPQDHADHLLRVWQQNRHLPVAQRLARCNAAPANSNLTNAQLLDRVLARVTETSRAG